MWVNKVTLMRLGYDEKECRNIVKAMEGYAPGEERMEIMTVSGNRHGIETMQMRLFVKSYRSEDFIRGCRRKIEGRYKRTNVQRWERLIEQIGELMQKETAA